MTMSYGIIFDMDGVLVDSGDAHYEAWRRVGAEEGVPYPRAFFDRTFGMHNRQTIPLWLGRRVSEEAIARLAERKEALYRQSARKLLRPIPGAVELVCALAREGIRLAVGSSGPRANIALGLELLGIASFFRALATGDDVKRGKPAPDIFLYAASQLAIQPKRCVVIEDAPPGIEAAHAAGMRVIALPTSRPAAQLVAADMILPSFHDWRMEFFSRFGIPVRS